MSITAKTASVLVGLFVALLLGAWVILENAVRPGFERLEVQAQESDKARVEARLATLAQDMSTRVRDYAGWDESYSFIAGENDAFIGENFTDDWLGGYNLDLAVFTNDAGDILWSKERGAVGNVGPGLNAANAILRSVRATPIGAEPVTGVFWSVEGPMMFAAAHATRNDGTGTPRGIVVFARRLSREALRAQVQLDVQLISLAQAPPDLAAHLQGLEHARSETWATDASMHSLIALRDGRGKLVGAVLGTRARDITALGVSLIGTTLLLFAIMSALAVAALWVLLRRVVISRIVRLEQHFNAQSNAIEPIEAVSASRDEIGSLTAAYNALVVRLREMAVSQRDTNLAREAEAAANRMKSDFLANISHELRTPLNAVIGYAELIEEDLTDLGLTTATEDLNRIRAAGRHLLSLITEILDLSKIEAGKMEITPSSFGIEEMLTMVVDTIRPLARQNDNVLSVDIEPGMGNAYSDELRLRQSLINILSNACKYTSGGAVLLRARRCDIDGRAFLRFEVKDTGIGMTEEQLAQVFEPFVQADASITRRFGGTGLGLSITRKIMVLLGGGIEATSREGQGSTFVLTLPAVSADTGAAPSEHATQNHAHQAA